MLVNVPGFYLQMPGSSTSQDRQPQACVSTVHGFGASTSPIFYSYPLLCHPPTCGLSLGGDACQVSSNFHFAVLFVHPVTPVLPLTNLTRFTMSNAL